MLRSTERGYATVCLSVRLSVSDIPKMRDLEWPLKVIQDVGVDKVAVCVYFVDLITESDVSLVVLA